MHDFERYVGLSQDYKRELDKVCSDLPNVLRNNMTSGVFSVNGLVTSEELVYDLSVTITFNNNRPNITIDERIEKAKWTASGFDNVLLKSIVILDILTQKKLGVFRVMQKPTAKHLDESPTATAAKSPVRQRQVRTIEASDEGSDGSDDSDDNDDDNGDDEIGDVEDEDHAGQKAGPNVVSLEKVDKPPPSSVPMPADSPHNNDIRLAMTDSVYRTPTQVIFVLYVS